jgi:hypothetical protein
MGSLNLTPYHIVAGKCRVVRHSKLALTSEWKILSPHLELEQLPQA